MAITRQTGMIPAAKDTRMACRTLELGQAAIYHLPRSCIDNNAAAIHAPPAF